MSPALIKSILDTAITIFASDELLPRAAFEKLAREAIASSDGNYSIQEAVKWAE
jgi:histone H3/H4